MSNSKTFSAVAVALFLSTGCSNGHNTGDLSNDLSLSDTEANVSQFSNSLEIIEGRRVFEPQVMYLQDGTLTLIWRERGEEGSNIFSAVRQSDGPFGMPVQVNDVSETVESVALDGMRAATAVGAGDTFAVAWSDTRAQIRATISSDGGKTFQPSIRLDQSGAPAYRGFPAISFDAAEDLHAVWIDSRFAADFAEEPADLFYAMVSNGSVTEKNLTAQQEPSICGCCRTFIDADGADLKITFRNTTANGFRDPNTVSGSIQGEFSQPASVSAPLWELTGCPMAGPIQVGDEVLWPDGSTGKKLIMTASVEARNATPMFDEAQRGDWIGRQSPRAVSTAQQNSSVLLLPGQPSSRLVARDNDKWHTIISDLPSWATSAAYSDGHLLLVGTSGGEFKNETREIPANLQSKF
jgi:hypothetical protein